MRNIRRIAGILTLALIIGLAFLVKLILPGPVDLVADTSDILKTSIMAYIAQDVQTLHKEQVTTQILKERDAQDAIRFWRHVTTYASISLLILFHLTGLLISIGLYRKFSTHLLKTKHSEIPFRGSLPPEIATGLVLAEQIEAQQPDKAIELYARLAEVNVKQLTALSKFHLPLARQEGAEQAGETRLALAATGVPSFHDLLQRGELAPGKPMILGYEHGVPRRGSFLDIYSAAIAGESGSGKTGTLLFLIGSGLIAQSIRFVAIDPHYPHPKSLAFKTKALWEAKLMTMATYKDDMLEVLSGVEQTIDARLKQQDTDETPVVLVIDELAFLAKSSLGPALSHTMERISTEGRKCAVYMLASSQTWLAASTGKNSMVRDTLTSAYVHRIKPKQANLLLQDKDEVNKVKHQVKGIGTALLVPVGSDSVVVEMPYTTDADMKAIAEAATSAREPTPNPSQEGNASPAATSSGGKPAQFPSQEGLGVGSSGGNIAQFPSRKGGGGSSSPASVTFDLSTEYGLRSRARTLQAAGVISYGSIGKHIGISKSTAHVWLNNPHKTLLPEQKTALRHYFEHLNDDGEPADKTA